MTITLFLPIVLVVIMFSLGLGLVIDDFARLGRHPKAFAVGLLVQFVLMPTTAYVIALVFGLAPDMALGLMILSLCPGGPTANLMTRYSHGDVALSISLNGISSLAAVVTMPLLAAFFVDHFLGAEAPEIEVTSLGLSMFAITTIPVVAGMLVRRYAPALTEIIDIPTRKLSMLLLVAIISGALLVNWNIFVATLPVLGPSVVMLASSLLVGGLALAWSTGLEPGQATAVSIDAGIQNAALGITVGALIAGPDAAVPIYSVPAGVYGVTMYFIVIPYMFWRRSLARPATAQLPT
ncbi:bile acid:sodium symporter [Aquibium sp. LZ166]|uniref:Bile acid:sodium symporter n=1 Tax=Aquibium pacificus TaxID=3153579 RepID=A0ABV3SD13_9HYPH